MSSRTKSLPRQKKYQSPKKSASTLKNSIKTVKFYIVRRQITDVPQYKKS